MFWKLKSTLDRDDEEWQLLSWGWMLRNLGDPESLRYYQTALPTHAHFAPSGLKGHAHALFVFNQVIDRFGLSSSVFDLVAQGKEINPVVGKIAIVKNAPVNPLGTYSRLENMNRHQVTYSPSLLSDLEAMIATFSHEICHSILPTVREELPGGFETEEFATDLATIFYGFGIFGGNNAFKSKAFTDAATGMQGWQTSRAGYLTQNEWGFGLAVRTLLLREKESDLLRHLDTGLSINYRKNLRYLRKNPKLFEEFGVC